MLEIKKIECPENKINLKCPYTMTPSRIVIHNTANDAPAKNEIKYMHSNNKKVSFHFAVDDTEIIQGIELDRNSFNAGDGAGKGNREGIAIEICYSKFGGERFEKAQRNAAELTAYLLKKYGWGIDKITKHQDYNGKNCPHRTLGDYGWDYFLNLVKEFLEPKEAPDPSPVADKPNKVKEWQLAAIADGFKFPKYGADGMWGSECISVAKSAICKKRNMYKYPNLTRIVQRAVGVKIDGLFGNNTKTAVKNFQAYNGLTADGCVGLNTWKKILGV